MNGKNYFRAEGKQEQENEFTKRAFPWTWLFTDWLWSGFTLSHNVAEGNCWKIRTRSYVTQNNRLFLITIMHLNIFDVFLLHALWAGWIEKPLNHTQISSVAFFNFHAGHRVTESSDLHMYMLPCFCPTWSVFIFLFYCFYIVGNL